jgi:hypothetical protein
MSQGKPVAFDVDVYLDAVEMMINADEVERAFWMLDNMPGYYRDHVPLRAKEIWAQLHANLHTTALYKGEYDDLKLDPREVMDLWPGRAQIVAQAVKWMNVRGHRPHLMEFAPGSGFLPFGLNYLGLDFSYEYRGLDCPNYRHTAEIQKYASNVFIAFEVIEHLSNEFEIYQNYTKFGREADFVFLSTPLYTINGGELNWQSRQLGHLRTYTPNEFLSVAKKMFRGYQFTVITDETIVLVGAKHRDPREILGYKGG